MQIKVTLVTDNTLHCTVSHMLRSFAWHVETCWMLLHVQIFQWPNYCMMLSVCSIALIWLMSNIRTKHYVAWNRSIFLQQSPVWLWKSITYILCPCCIELKIMWTSGTHTSVNQSLQGCYLNKPQSWSTYPILDRVRNCDQLVANATENVALATRISRPVASRRLTFSIVSLFWTTAQGIKSKNFTFDFNKKLTSRLVEVFNPHIK